MVEDKFTEWKKWEYRDDLPEVMFPGVYFIAKSELDLAEHNFDWIKEIEYVGMTNHKKLKDRLNEFDITISGKRFMHGGADRCLYANPNYQELSPKLFVSVKQFRYEIKLANPKYIRIMGDILRCESYCIAKYAEKFNELPKFNNPKSPKYSKNKENSE